MTPHKKAIGTMRIRRHRKPRARLRMLFICLLAGSALLATLYVSLHRKHQAISSNLGERMAKAPFHKEHAKKATESQFCHKNPYLSSLQLNHTAIQTYQSSLASMRQRAEQHPANKHDHKRFRVFQELAHCKDELACVGGECGEDVSKIVCGLHNLQRNDCIIYSIGGNNKWDFELDLLNRTNCHIHTFDCTGKQSRFEVPPHDRLHFHYECLHGGSSEKPGPRFFTLEELTQKYKHSQIDLFKMDIEGFEYGVFESFQHMNHHQLPMQLLVELHYRSQFTKVSPDREHDFMTEVSLIDLAGRLLKLGYVVANRDDNQACLHCTELTLMRVYC